MDWIRRNWPDLLIAIALVAVIAGIIATLLSGGSLWPTSRGGGNQPLTSTGRSAVNGTGVNGGANAPVNLRTGNAANNNAANLGGGLTLGNAPGVNGVNGANVEVVSPAVNNGLNGTGANLNVGTGQRNLNANTGATLAAPLSRNNTGTSLAAPLSSPLASSPRAGSSLSADINNGNNRALSIAPNANNAGGTVAGGVVSANGVTIPNSANANTAGTQQLSGNTSFASTQAISVNPANAATSDGSYKISVGAFGVVANAQNLANRLNQQGYPVGYDQQGSLNVVYVGPYASRAQADAVSGQLRQAGQDTSVYADPQAVASNQQFAATGQAGQQNFQQNFQQQQAVTSNQTVAPAGVGRSYLQVGAYLDVPSSLTQRSTLERLGLTVYDRREGGYVKLIVGPFAENEVGIYRSQLLDRGIDSFPVN